MTHKQHTCNHTTGMVSPDCVQWNELPRGCFDEGFSAIATVALSDSAAGETLYSIVLYLIMHSFQQLQTAPELFLHSSWASYKYTFQIVLRTPVA